MLNMKIEKTNAQKYLFSICVLQNIIKIKTWITTYFFENVSSTCKDTGVVKPCVSMQL